MTTPNPLIVMEGGMVRIDDSGNIRSGTGCCCTDCCDFAEILETGAVLSENYWSPMCCAYLEFGIYGSPTITMPVGISGVWTGPTAYVPFDMTSACVNAGYIDHIENGFPVDGPIHTTTQRSILMVFAAVTIQQPTPTGAIGAAAIEVFLDSNCCPTSIQTHEPEGFEGYFDAAPTLAFGPATVANYFEGPYDLFICEGPPLGACCIGGDLLGTGISQYNCEVIGDGINPGTWYEEGTYDPDDPCNPLP